ncbi:MAG: flavodoxin family protein [Promethearchaeota archaeon]
MSNKILAIIGSPRKSGLIATQIAQFESKIKELNQSGDKNVDIEVLRLSDYKIEHCNGCDSCLRKPYECPLSEKDDMLKVENAMKSADAIVIGAPSYFAAMPGIVKDLVDRSRPMKMARYQLKDKYLSVITASGLVGGGSNWVADGLIHWALIQGMIIVGALGHPVLEGNLPSETLQMQGLKKFRNPSEIGEISKKVSENLAERIWDLLK